MDWKSEPTVYRDEDGQVTGWGFGGFLETSSPSPIDEAINRHAIATGSSGGEAFKLVIDSWQAEKSLRELRAQMEVLAERDRLWGKRGWIWWFRQFSWFPW